MTTDNQAHSNDNTANDNTVNTGSTTKKASSKKLGQKKGVTHLKPKAMEYTISKRAKRVGKSVSVKEMFARMAENRQGTSVRILQDMADKYGIRWTNGIDMKPGEGKGPAHPFVMQGKYNGLNVFYDRQQLTMFFRDKNGELVAKFRTRAVRGMTPKQLEKAVTPATKKEKASANAE